MPGHWLGSNRRNTLPPNWSKIRSAVRRRANGRCEWQRVAAAIGWPVPVDRPCPSYGTDADHIHDRDRHTPEDLAWLCHEHHKGKSAWEGVTARREIAAKRVRPEPPHPGLL